AVRAMGSLADGTMAVYEESRKTTQPDSGWLLTSSMTLPVSTAGLTGATATEKFCVAVSPVMSVATIVAEAVPVAGVDQVNNPVAESMLRLPTTLRRLKVMELLSASTART